MSSQVPVANLTIYKGSDKNFTLNVSGLSDLTNAEVTFYVRAIAGGTPVILKSSTDPTEIEITDAINKIAVIYMKSTDTSLLESKRYVYDLWIKNTLNNETQPILTGFFWIQDVAPTMISQVRGILDEAGELRIQTVTDEYIMPSTTTELYISRTRIRSVEGVWLLEDDTHSGTNYYTGGGFDSMRGVVWLGTQLPTVISHVRANYTWEAGISDDAINWHLAESREFVVSYTGIEFNYGQAATQEQRAAEHMALARCIIGCILTINGANVAQMGYNFRIDEFEIQSKLWGEGMIAEALFNVYMNQFNQWLQALGKRGYVVVATPIQPKYDLNQLIGLSSDEDN